MKASLDKIICLFKKEDHYLIKSQIESFSYYV